MRPFFGPLVDGPKSSGRPREMHQGKLAIKKLSLSDFLAMIIVMKFIISFILFSLVSEIQAKVHLRYGLSDFATYEDPIINLTSQGFPLRPLIEEKRELSVTPAYFSIKKKLGDESEQDEPNRIDIMNNEDDTWQENEAKGLGIMGSYYIPKGKSWGYSFIVSFAKMSGETFGIAEYDAGGQLTKTHMADEKGYAMMSTALLIYDPLYDKKRVNTPLYLGVGVLHTKQEAELSTTVDVTGLPANTPVKYSTKINNTHAGVMLGGSVQLNILDYIRVSPFLGLFVMPTKSKSETEVTNANTGAEIFSGGEDGDLGVYRFGGVGFNYLPWDVTVRWIPNLQDLDSTETESSFTMLTVTKTFSF